jgi:hypothetical protein
VCVVARACVVTGIGHDGSITRHGRYRVRTRDILRKRGVVLCGVVWCCVGFEISSPSPVPSPQ